MESVRLETRESTEGRSEKESRQKRPPSSLRKSPVPFGSVRPTSTRSTEVESCSKGRDRDGICELWVLKT